jgi:predicted transposase/invertase (TIGR01784 family)
MDMLKSTGKDSQYHNQIPYHRRKCGWKRKEIPEHYDLLTAVMVCLGDPNEENYNGLLKMLDVLLSNRREPEEKKKVLKEEFDIEMTKDMEEEVHSMSHILQGVKESVFADAIQQGMQQGIEQGELSKAKDMAYNLARLGVSLDKIAEAAKVSIQTIRQWLDSSGMTIA